MVTIREVNSNDKNFIYSTFLKGVYYGSDWMAAISKEIFFIEYAKAIERLLARPTVQITVACLSDDIDTVLGYAIHEGAILHYIYVKQPWRLQGIAKQLVTVPVLSTVTHITKPGNAIRIKKGLTFNPWLI